MRRNVAVSFSWKLFIAAGESVIVSELIFFAKALLGCEASTP